ncbi:Oidioi.mRNA.OKI2018_I69.XSR.g14798.t1.cds [Oikopleura dioica]|uniref:Oidioi.mRNA.OKI2018_I69.XSR.g14798.t1.cds n=1 Tax=Oikopleura dioica TaxID=34765 RepID=A0ABN7SAV4_OIKDI|nr:Oidioi.mRNA.OKI2018_I69.XSR.g14798.t1.cds [Oikopleura dioica]
MDKCIDDSFCSNDGQCYSGQCRCSVHWSGPDCTKHNLIYFTSFSVIFYCITLCCFIQLGICIRSEYAKQKQKSLNQACRITVQKFLYSCSAIACLIRGLLFSLGNDSLDTEQYENCPRFLTKSRLAFTIFNACLIGVLFINFTASHFQEHSAHSPNLVFPTLFAIVLFIVHVLFLIIGIEMFCKIRGEFVMNTKSETKEKIDVVQAAHSRVGLFFQCGLTVLLVVFILADVFGGSDVIQDIFYRDAFEVTFRLMELGVVLWFPCILWNSTNPEELWALNPRKLLKPAKREALDLRTDQLLVQSPHDAECWICYDAKEDDLIQPCDCKGDVKWVHQKCLQRWIAEKSQGDKPCCQVCKQEYLIYIEKIDFDDTLKKIHWFMVVPSFVTILFAPYGTYLLCRQVDEYRISSFEKHHTLIKSAAVVLCCFIEYALFRFIGTSGFKLYRTAVSRARAPFYTRLEHRRKTNKLRWPEKVLAQSLASERVAVYLYYKGYCAFASTQFFIYVSPNSATNNRARKVHVKVMLDFS